MAPLPHLTASRRMSYVAVSRISPLADFQPYKKRMGWKFPWVSSAGSRFQLPDFQASFTEESMAAGKNMYNFDEAREKKGANEAPGASVFIKDKNGDIYHTYSSYGRGLDIILGTYQLARHHAEGPQRRRQHVRLDATPRRIRGLRWPRRSRPCNPRSPTRPRCARVLKDNAAATCMRRSARKVISLSGAGYTGFSLAPPLKIGGGENSEQRSKASTRGSPHGMAR